MDIQNEINPYEAVSTKSIGIESRQELLGFARGARNGFLWSLPIVTVLTLHISTYGRTPPHVLLAMLEALQVSVIWSAAAGIVAAVLDCSKSNANIVSDLKRESPRSE